MAVFRDESGRRARAARIASVLGAAGAVAALGVFFVSIAPAVEKAALPEPAPAGKLAAGHPLESKARERTYRAEEARLRGLVAEAQAAQRRRKRAEAREP